jgi:hypothetical protein
MRAAKTDIGSMPKTFFLSINDNQVCALPGYSDFSASGNNEISLAVTISSPLAFSQIKMDFFSVIYNTIETVSRSFGILSKFILGNRNFLSAFASLLKTSPIYLLAFLIVNVIFFLLSVVFGLGKFHLSTGRRNFQGINLLIKGR